MTIMGFIGTVMKNLFSKPVTTQYPAKEMDYPKATRGQIAIDIDACIFCGICEKKCPADAISVSRNDKNWSIKRFGCIQCAACVEACPKKCLSMNNEYTPPAGKKSTDSFVKTVSE